MARSNVRRDEHGAVAILFALLAVVLLGVGALAVDIGQAYAKRSLLQTDVDLAVMAAASKLDNPGACNDAVVAKAVEFLSKSENAVPGQYAINLGGSPGDTDGYIRCQDWKVELWAPKSHVTYGLARVLTSAEGIDVSSHAVAQIKAASGVGTMPFFAAKGCESGAQSIRNNSGISTPPPVPPLTPDSASHNKAIFTISPTSTPAGTTSMTITLTGSGFTGATSVGFTGAAGPPYHYLVPISPTPTKKTTSITVGVPSGVLAVQDVWYVRVLAGSEWSEVQLAQPFTVGPPKLYCDASLQGNFGTVDLPRTDTNSFPLEWNMIRGIQPTLAIHPSPNGQCDGQAGSVESKNTPVNGTNCVLTEPGLKMAATNDGLIAGKGGLPGRLDKDSTNNCSRSNNNNRTPTAINGKFINDDLLSCFIVNGAHISDLVAGNSVGAGALSSDIFASPRFFWVPVLQSDPSTGAKSWPIVDFRPGFISDQSLTATRAAPGAISEFDGLVPESSGIRELRVILFNQKSLPEFAPTVGGESNYTGSGPKAIVLVE